MTTATFRPTRSCPHPLCKPLHAITAAASLIAISALAPVSPWLLAAAVISVLFSIGIYQLVHRQTLTATITEEINQTASLTARPGWARAAAALDALMALLSLALLAALLTDRSTTWSQAPSRYALLAAIAVSAAAYALGEVLHRRAVHIHRDGTQAPAA